MIQRQAPRSELDEKQQPADEREVFVEMRLIGGARRAVHGPDIVDEHQRQRDKDNQDDGGQRVWLTDKNENPAEQIDRREHRCATMPPVMAAIFTTAGLAM